MEQELIVKLLDLNDEILKTEEYINFKNKEKELISNDEVALLSYKKDMAIVDYEDTLKHFKKGTNEEINALKRMKQSVDSLNSHEVVKSYNDALTKLNLLMNEVEEQIFEGIDD